MKTLCAVLVASIGVSLMAQSSITWTDAMSVAPRNSGNMRPRVALDAGGNPMIIYGREGTGSIMFVRWTGSMFSAPIMINTTETPAFSATWAGPDIASHGDTVHVVYKMTPEVVNGIYCVTSLNGGLTFSKPVRVESIADSVCRFPCVTVDESGNPIVAFMKFNKDFSNARWVVTRSTDYGRTFGTDVLASGYSGGAVCDCCPGSIVANGNNVVMLYRDELKNLRDTWIGISRNGAVSFPRGLPVDQNKWMINSCPSTGPDGVIIGDTIYSVFMNAASGKGLIYHNANHLDASTSIRAPAAAPAIMQLASQNFPRMASHGRSIVEVWQQTVGNSSQVALIFTPDIQRGFSAAVEVLASANVGIINNPDVAMYNGVVRVVYQDNATGTVRLRTGVVTSSSVVDGTMEESIHVYPHPLRQNVMRCSWSSLNAGLAHYSISTLAGQELVKGEILHADTAFDIELPTLQPGVYQLVLVSGGKTLQQLFVRE